MSFFGLFGKDPKELFLSFTPMNSTWRVVTWNFDLNDSSKRRWMIETQGPRDLTIHWEQGARTDLLFFENEKLLRRRRISESNRELSALMNLSIHSTLKYGIESNHAFMLTPVVGATTADIPNETRALQWIQATFGTLTRALDSLTKNKSLVLTGACFSGKVPENGEEVLRVIAFNLDIFYYFREDQTLQIVVFDDKNMGHGGSKTPTFQQIIKVTKPQFYDELIKLIHRLAEIGEIG